MCDGKVRERCVLKKSLHCGIQVFFFEHCSTGDHEFDDSFIRVYESATAVYPFITLHKENTIPVLPTDHLIHQFGGEYPDDDWFIANRAEWENG